MRTLCALGGLADALASPPAQSQVDLFKLIHRGLLDEVDAIASALVPVLEELTITCTEIRGDAVTACGRNGANAHDTVYRIGNDMVLYLAGALGCETEPSSGPSSQRPLCEDNRQRVQDALRLLDVAELRRIEGQARQEALITQRRLTQQAHATNWASATPPPAAKPDESEGDSGAGSTSVQSKIPSDVTREAVFNQLEPAARKAYLACQYAETMNTRTLQDWGAHEWLKENGIHQDKGDLGELTDYQLPAFETWSRYVRKARKALGEQKYTSPVGRKKPMGRRWTGGILRLWTMRTGTNTA